MSKLASPSLLTSYKHPPAKEQTTPADTAEICRLFSISIKTSANTSSPESSAKNLTTGRPLNGGTPNSQVEVICPSEFTSLEVAPMTTGVPNPGISKPVPENTTELTDAL